MPEMTKLAGIVGNHYLKALPKDFIEDISSHVQEKEIQEQCFENIGKMALRINQTQLKEGLSTRQLRSEGNPLTTIALSILFPDKIATELQQIADLPDATLEEKKVKEKAFRKFVSSQFTLKEVKNDKNNALRAIIVALDPEIGSDGQKATAQILRGDIVEHVEKNPELFQTSRQTSIEHWGTQITQSKRAIGEFEVRVMGEILESPIHILSYQNPELALNPSIHAEKAICLYFDPIHTYYLPAI